MNPQLALADITPDTPLRLSVAAGLAFPDGTMTASGLRREARRGRLVIERIAGKDYVTMAAIADMRFRCRVVAEQPVPVRDEQRIATGTAAVLAMAERLKRRGRAKKQNP